jgi:gluconokinase
LVIVLMGAAGAGKTTVGRALADAAAWSFLDADDLHAPSSIERMAAGEPLTESERAPWLWRVRGAIEEALCAERSLVVACSALRKEHRDVLTAGLAGVRLVFLDASPELLRHRLVTRKGHFASSALLDSQLSVLERPDADVLTVDASLPVDTLVAAVRNAFAV